MRAYILTKKEKEIIAQYFRTGIKIEGFAMLKHRIEKNHERLWSDMYLIRDFLKAIEVER